MRLSAIETVLVVNNTHSSPFRKGRAQGPVRIVRQSRFNGRESNPGCSLDAESCIQGTKTLTGSVFSGSGDDKLSVMAHYRTSIKVGAACGSSDPVAAGRTRLERCSAVGLSPSLCCCPANHCHYRGPVRIAGINRLQVVAEAQARDPSRISPHPEDSGLRVARPGFRVCEILSGSPLAGSIATINF